MVEIRKAIMLPDRRKLPPRPKSINEQVIELRAMQFIDTLVMCQEMNKLPKDGGLFDQDSYFVYLMKYAMLCQSDRRELDNRKATQSR